MMTLSTLLAIGTMYEIAEIDMWKDIEIDSRINKDVLIFTILRNCSQSYVLFDTYGSFKQMSDIFFQKWAYQISKLLNTQEFEYTPIWNKDGIIKEQRNLERNEKEAADENYLQNSSSSDSATDNHDVSPYNNNNYLPESKDSSSTSAEAELKSNRDTSRNRDASEGEDIYRVEQGNIGVTSTQSLIQEERALYEFNIYDWIVEKYQRELFYKVW